MPSVRIRRGSLYSTLLGEDGDEGRNTETGGRRRSRTLTSIFQTRPPTESTSQGTPNERFQAQEDEGNTSPSGQTTTSSSDYSAPRSVTGKVASSIRSSSVHMPLRGHRSHPAFSWDERQPSSSQQRHSLTLEGSQANIIIPTGDGGGMGRIGSSFSLPRTNSQEYDDEVDDRSDEFHHDDDIVEHLDVIGECCVSALCSPVSLDTCRPRNRYNIKSCQRRQCNLDVSIELIHVGSILIYINVQQSSYRRLFSKTCGLLATRSLSRQEGERKARLRG